MLNNFSHCFFLQYHHNMKVLLYSFLSTSKIIALKIPASLSSPPGWCPPLGNIWLLILCCFQPGTLKIMFLMWEMSFAHFCYSVLQSSAVSTQCFLSNREHTFNVLNVMFVVGPFPHLRIQELLLEGGDVNKLRTRHQNMIIFSLSKNPVTSKQVYTFQFSLFSMNFSP